LDRSEAEPGVEVRGVRLRLSLLLPSKSKNSISEMCLSAEFTLPMAAEFEGKRLSGADGASWELGMGMKLLW